MSRKSKIIFPLLFVLIYALTGCGSSQETDFQISGASTSYKEEQSSFTSDMEKISAGKEAYIYKDFSSEYGRLMDYYVLQDGSAYFLYENALTQEIAASSAGYEHYILKYTKESDSYETLNLDIPNCYMENILVSPQGHLALAGADTTYLYRLNASASQDAGPEAFARIRADSRLGFLFTSDGGIVCMPVPGESYISYDLDTGNKNGVFLDKKHLYSGASDLYPYLQQAGDTILLVTGKGIYEKKANGWILQVSSEANSMSRSDFYAQGVWKGTQEDFYIKTGSTLYHYVKDDNIQKPEISLKLQSCVDYPLMKDIIAGYRTARPDVSVEYTCLEATLPGSRQEIDSMQQRMNAQIVSNSAADIYILDYLPRNAYQEKGYLAPLNSLAGEIMRKEDCFANIIKACYHQENIYFMPVCYSANMFVYRNELEGAIKDIFALAAYLDNHPHAQSLPPYTYAGNAEYCVDQMYRAYGQQLYQDGHITENTIRSFLTSMKTIFDRTNQTKASAAPMYTARYDKHASLMPDELWRLDAHQEGIMSAGPFSGSSYFLLFQGANMNGFSFTLNDYFIPELMLGIHSKTEWKEEAEDFIRYAFAYAHENASKLTSIPVFRDGLVPRMQNSLNRIHEKYRTTENHYIVTYGAENEARTLYAPTQEDYAMCYEPLLNGLKAIGQEPSLTDPVYLIYASSAISFLNGDITIEQAVDEIRSRLSLLEN